VYAAYKWIIKPKTTTFVNNIAIVLIYNVFKVIL